MTAISPTATSASTPNYRGPQPARRSMLAETVRTCFRNPRILIGGTFLILIIGTCIVTMLWTTNPASTMYFDAQYKLPIRAKPSLDRIELWFGTDKFGRSILARCLLGGVVSIAVGLAAAFLSVILGVTVGLLAGFRGGWIDSTLMRLVDILYGLPYILLIILFKIAFEDPLTKVLNYQAANLVVLFGAIGLVSWLTMARVVRGQVLSLRGQPFIEACHAMGVPDSRIFIKHLLPNLVGPITVYATLTIPQAILQESFLSFLGVGVNPPLPTWGSLASENRLEALNQYAPYWWMLAFPCIMLALTLLSLNFLGDGLRDIVDPKREAAKL